MVLHGDTAADRFWAATICTDQATASLMLAAAHDGEVWEIPPNEGGPLRKYLAGENPPLMCRMAKYPDNLIPWVSSTAGVSETLARSAVADVIRESGGIGAQLYFA